MISYFILLFSLCNIHFTNALTIIVGVSFGTRSHVTPFFEPLRMLSNRNHSIIYAAPKRFDFAKEYPFIETVFIEENTTRDSRELPPLLGYTEQAQSWLKLLDERKPDLLLCDYFADSCLDVAVHTNTAFAVLGGLGYMGYMGIGSEWFIPPFTRPMPQQEWLSSPLLRLSHYLFDPFWDYWEHRELTARHNQLRAEMGFSTTVDPIKYLQNVLFFSHSVIGLVPARYARTSD